MPVVLRTCLVPGVRRVELYVASAGPVKLFISTPSQYYYFQSLYMQQVWNFAGPAYYYGGEFTVFNTQVMLGTEQLSGGGYYLITSNVLLNANTVHVTVNAIITYIPQTPNIPS